MTTNTETSTAGNGKLLERIKVTVGLLSAANLLTQVISGVIQLFR
ncbi:hypothetical protein ACFVUY_06115 [Kitasatospora sp. NPDC058063]